MYILFSITACLNSLTVFMPLSAHYFNLVGTKYAAIEINTFFIHFVKICLCFSLFLLIVGKF